jgi:hypothetical protein
MARHTARKQAQLKIYVCYDQVLDQHDRDRLEALFAEKHEVAIVRPVDYEEFPVSLKTDEVRQKIREDHLRDSVVTVVLVGASTWKRKLVDWEIGASVRHTQMNPRSGLLGILLPSYTAANKGRHDPHTMPPRLDDNVGCKFARVYEWSDEVAEVKSWIDQAFQDRSNVTPTNARLAYPSDRNGKGWS